MAEFHRDLVTHLDIEAFAKERVNIKAEQLAKYRKQVNRVRDMIKGYIDENPEVGFSKTLLSGSLAKHTAISTMGDVDIALYLNPREEWSDLNTVLEYVREKLVITYPPPTPIKIDPPCVVIQFLGTGLDVDIMPVLDAGGNEGYGTIWDSSTLEDTYTSIPRHLDFIAKRRAARNPHFAQVVRLLKYWKHVNGVKFRSFVIELIVAKLADEGTDFSNYLDALSDFFNFVANSDLVKPVYFTDYFSSDEFALGSSPPVEIWDPVTPNNNVTLRFPDHERVAISDACADAADAISEARNTTLKGEAVQRWKDLFGSSFSA